MKTRIFRAVITCLTIAAMTMSLAGCGGGGSSGSGGTGGGTTGTLSGTAK